jgi:hypothetical protein
MNFSFPLCNRQYFSTIGLLALGLVLSLSNSALAQISLSGTSYTQNFDSMGSTGTTTPTGWTVDSTANTGASGTITDAPVNTDAVSATTTVTAGTGSSATGANYNFGVLGTNPVTDRALGSLASASLQRDTYASFTNNTGLSIAQFTITYDGEQWRLGDNPSAINVLTLQYSATGASGSWVGLGSSFNFSSPITSGAIGARDGNAAANRIAGIGGTYTPSAQITNGSSFYLRWADPDDGGGDNAIALDNFSISLSLVPEPSTWIAGILAFGGIICSQRKRIAAMLAARTEVRR